MYTGALVAGALVGATVVAGASVDFSTTGAAVVATTGLKLYLRFGVVCIG